MYYSEKLKYNSKKICLFFFMLLSTFFCLSNKALAFGGKTHKRITEEAIKQVDIGLPHNRIIAGCTYPDEVENSNLYSGHFYDPLLDFERQNKDNALTRMKAHYNQAKEAFRRNDNYTAAHELGQAVHYIQDMCCAVHTWGYKFNMLHLPFHKAYEDKIDSLKEYYFPSVTPLESDDIHDIQQMAIYFSKQSYNDDSALFVRVEAGHLNVQSDDKIDKIFGRTITFASLGGLNPLVNTNAIIVRKTPDNLLTYVLDAPLEASCNLIYNFCLKNHVGFSEHSSSGRVNYPKDDCVIT